MALNDDVTRCRGDTLPQFGEESRTCPSVTTAAVTRTSRVHGRFGRAGYMRRASVGAGVF